MNYFSKRNNYQVEYSGYEEASAALRKRLVSIMSKYIDDSKSYFGSSYSKSWIDWDELKHEVQKYILTGSPLEIVKTASFHEVFTVVEIYWDLAGELDGQTREEIYAALCQAFFLAGSVYQIHPSTGRIELIPNEELAESIKKTEAILEPFGVARDTFLEAVGNLYGRKAKPGDVVRDIFVAAEGYLKAITNETQYSSAVDILTKRGTVNREQKATLEKLYAFRSNTAGTTHAGSAPEPSEAEAVWFLETMIAQLRYVDAQAKAKK